MTTSRSRGAGRLPGVEHKPPFDAVVEAHGPTIWRVCRAAVAGADADDVWSETFLAALAAWPDLPADANVEAWLVTIAHRKAIDLHRRCARSSPIDTGDLDQVAAPNGEGRDLDLVASLAALPTRQRLALAYHHLGGLPYREVAELVGGTPEAARRAASDGLASLRRHHPHLKEDLT